MDPIDRQLIVKLQEDGRAKLVKLGKSLDLSHVAVKDRLNRLLREEKIKVSANLSVKEFNLKMVTILVEVESYKRLKELIEIYKDCPRLVFMSTLIGTYNLMAIMVAENQTTLESMTLGTCSLRGQNGIRHSVAHLSGSTIHPLYLPIKLSIEKRDVAPCNISCDTCERYKSKQCLGCPATSFYRGSI